MASTYFDHINFYRNLLSTPRSKRDVGNGGGQSLEIVSDASDTTICARVRPLSADEEQSQHISGIQTNGLSKVVLYEPRMKFNGTPDANKHEYSLHRVFGVDTQTETLYREVAQELVPWIWAGGVSTLFAYGQTGSGKTFTVTGITNMIVKDIMAMAELDHRELHICCFEILGKKAYDLLDDRRVFGIMEDSFGTMQLVGAQEKCPTSEKEFQSLIQRSSLLRTSAPTAKNDQSSRSHAVYRIRTVNRSSPGKLDGELFLIDLAGSEGSQDSMKHSAERLVETKDINTSLSILKDCIRGRSLWGLQQLDAGTSSKRNVHIPWRSSKLTQVLKHVFGTHGERACKTVVVACVAPSIVDSAHSKNTLRYAEMLKVPVPRMKNQDDTMIPSRWTNEMTKQWIAQNSGTPPIDGSILAGDLNGMQLCKMPQKKFISLCLETAGVSKDQAVAFYQKLWRIRIDSRQMSSTFSVTEKTKTIQEPSKLRDERPFQQRIKPGMFICLAPGVSKFENAKFAMIMSPSGPNDFVETTDERKFICALVGPSIMTDAYDLYIERQETYSVKQMASEVLMEYDTATRYYYIDL